MRVRWVAGLLLAWVLSQGGCFIGHGKDGRRTAHVGNGLLGVSGIALIAGTDGGGAALGTLFLLGATIGTLGTLADDSKEAPAAAQRVDLASDGAAGAPVRAPSPRRMTPELCGRWWDAVAARPARSAQLGVIRRMPAVCLKERPRWLVLAPAGRTAEVRTPPGRIMRPDAFGPEPKPTNEAAASSSPAASPSASPSPSASAPPSPPPATRALTRAQCDQLWLSIDAEVDLDRRGALEKALPTECR
ncbi:MAG: hypothetical protein IT370_27220 [Deltaproteobacteria bacterium]|nr:hypothetical protein [Deltaproteobacteria bacterium]